MIDLSEINLKNYFKAEQYLKKIINTHNTDEFNYLCANILKVQNKYSEAINYYKKAIKNKEQDKTNTLRLIKSAIKDKDIVYYDKHAGHDISYKEKLHRVIRSGDVVLVE